MTAKTRNVVAVVAGMTGAGMSTHLLGTYLRMHMVTKSVIVTVVSGVVTALVLYVATRGADEN